MAFDAWSWTDIQNNEKREFIREKLNALGSYVDGALQTAAEHSFDNTGTGIPDNNVQGALVTLDSNKANKQVLVLEAHSADLSQEPTGLDTPLQINFGAAQGDVSDPVMLSSAGTVTFNEAGQYTFHMNAQYGRVAENNISVLMYRFLINGVQSKPSIAAHISDATMILPTYITCTIDVSAGDTLTMEFIRDSSGDNSGGLFATSATTLDWESAPSSCLRIYKA